MLFTRTILSAVMLPASLAYGATFTPMQSDDVSRLANRIYVIEGGARTLWPYGIKCHRHTKQAARRICINTIKHAWRDWHAVSTPGVFVDFLADRYCPPSVDKQGNINWKRNIRSK